MQLTWLLKDKVCLIPLLQTSLFLDLFCPVEQSVHAMRTVESFDGNTWEEMFRVEMNDL